MVASAILLRRRKKGQKFVRLPFMNFIERPKVMSKEKSVCIYDSLVISIFHFDNFGRQAAADELGLTCFDFPLRQSSLYVANYTKELQKLLN